MKSLTEAFEQTISERRLFRRGQGILVAVSGGLDSMVLLRLMSILAESHAWKVIVAHLNHKLRGKSSDADARLVQRTAKELGLRAVLGSADVREIARREKLSLEMAARKARHEFLARTAAHAGIHSVALAHHADDQLELFFLRLFRGTGSQGLVGMQWRNPSPVDQRVELLRPLLNETRARLREYAAQNGVRFREDATNSSLDIQRNRIRHELLPLLKKHYQPALETVIGRVLDITSAEAEVTTARALEWLGGMVSARREKPKSGGPRLPFRDLEIAVQRRGLQIQLLKLGVAPDFDLIERLRLHSDRPVCVSRDKVVLRGGRGPLAFIRDTSGLVRAETVVSSVFGQNSIRVDLREPAGQAEFGGVTITWRQKKNKIRGLPVKVARCEWFDADRVGDRVILRYWQAGDRFQPIGMPLAVKLQDFFVSQKVPRNRRHDLILGVSSSGEVFWVEGMRISERFKLSESTIRHLQWRWQRA